ncbi:thioredoxin family protein [Ureibacillus acetophenoni]|uniref:Thiol-disulfide isomerase/thioredoxin n=1 Tax=Ureibacillus acetophenoni TaxID=614649 RepID=A0A285UKY5_9BACL|nr:thioredoxin family protein [Ureibacillus acetophenoni]SOC42357.1 thiol-disulfide isomerase/thioredoxin [Ureibacillus acetophenoni]
MEILQSVEQFEQYKKEERVVFMFSADWCGDCRFIDPVLPSIEADYPEFTFVKIDRDQFIDLCAELDVYGIPSFVAYDQGNETGRFVSKDRKTKEEIEAFLDGLAK